VLGFGLSLWLAIALLLRWLTKRPFEQVLALVGRGMLPLLLPVGLTVLATMSLIVSPQFPYGVNLVLTLAYEGSVASFLTSSLLAVALAHGIYQAFGPFQSAETVGYRRQWSGFWAGVAIVIVATAMFAVATPSWLWKDGEGQGNMFKYLRMAAAVSASGSLDIARADGASERATFGGFVSGLPRMGRQWIGETYELVWSIAHATLHGELYVGTMTATRANRSMFRSQDGGVYYINSPGPGLLLVPSYLVDRWLNRWLGWDRQVTAILFWNFIGALLVWEIFRSAREVDIGWGAAALTAFALAVSPPLLPYTYQIYPELPAALLLLYAFRKLFIEPAPSGRGLLTAAIALAFLPWLHQKYSVTAAVMGILAAWRVAGSAPGRSSLLGRQVLLWGPLALSAFSILVYHHALTGLILPDATFRAVGRSSFEPSNMLSGFLGLLFDVENGLFVYAPLYLLALAGIGTLALRSREIRFYLAVVVVSYLVVIASFPHWPGAVSSVGRYILSVAPLAALALVLVVRRSFSDGVLAGVLLALFAATFSFTVAFQKDLVSSHLPSQLLGRTLYSDPYQYLPNFLSEGIVGSGPAHWEKLAAIALGVGLLVFGLGPRTERDAPVPEHEASRYPRRLLLGASAPFAVLVVMAVFLEHVTSNETAKTGPSFHDTQSLKGAAGGKLSFDVGYRSQERGVWVPGAGATRFLVQTPEPLSELQVVLRNGPRPNRVQVMQRGADPIDVELAPSSRQELSLQLRRPYEFQGPAGRRWMYPLKVRSRAGFVPREEGTGEDTRHLGCFVVLSAM
jgi:hypothetical protein